MKSSFYHVAVNRRVVHACSVCFTLTALLILLANVANAQSSPGVIQGQVLDTETGLPVEGVRVSLTTLPDGESPMAATRSGPFGFYRLSAEQGNYQIELNHQAYEPLKSDLVLQNDTREPRLDKLTPLREDGVRIRFFDLFVYVNGVQTGLALEGVPVLVERYSQVGDQNPSDRRLIRTDANGNATLHGMRKGYYRFRANHEADGTIKPGWEAFDTNDNRQLVEKPHTANLMLKPVEQSLLVEVTGYDPIKEAIGPLPRVYIETEGLDPKDHEDVVVPTRTGETFNAGVLTFRGLPAIDWAVRTKKLGYEMATLTVEANAEAKLEPSPAKLTMELHSTQINIILNSPYQSADVLDGVEVQLTGVNGSYSAGIRRTSEVEVQNDQAMVNFDRLLPGNYRVAVSDTVSRTMDIQVQGKSLYEPFGWPPPKEYNIHFTGSTFVEAVDDSLVTTSLYVEPVPAKIRGKVIVAEEWQDSIDSFQSVFLAREMKGIEFRASEYMDGDLPDSYTLRTIDTDAAGEFVMSFIPGLYGIVIPGAEGLWGEGINWTDLNSEDGDLSFSGWPYYQKWPHSFESAQNFWYDIGGFAISSGSDFEVELFLAKNHFRVEGQLFFADDPTWSWVIGLDDPNDVLSSMTYVDFIANGGKITLSGGGMDYSVFPKLIASGGHQFVFKNIPPGSYTLGVQHPRYAADAQAVRLHDYDRPGVMPSTPPPPEWPDPQPMEPHFATMGVRYNNAAEIKMDFYRWVSDGEGGGEYQVTASQRSPDYIQIDALGDRVFLYDQVGVSSAYQVWYDMGDDGWFSFTGNQRPEQINIDGPNKTENVPALARSFELEVIAINRANPEERLTNVNVKLGDDTAFTTPAARSNMTSALNPETVTSTEWTWDGNYSVEAVGGTGLMPKVRQTLWMDRGLKVRGKVTNAVTQSPISGAAVKVLSHSGNNPTGAIASKSDGSFEHFAVSGKQVVFIEVVARGYQTFRKRLSPDQAVKDDQGQPKDLAHIVDVSLVPLEGPVIVPDSASLNRRGLFVPGVNKSGNQGLFNNQAAKDALDMTWSVSTKGRKHTLNLKRFDTVDGTPRDGDETLVLNDAVEEVWLIDQRKFNGNPLNTDPIPLGIPNPQDPHLVHAYLSDLASGKQGTVFHRRVFGLTQSIPETEQTTSGKVPLWKMPPEDAQLALLVVSQRGAVSTHAFTFTEEEKLTGLKLPTWLGFAADAMGTIAGAQKTEEDISEFMPEGRFSALPEFTASITLNEDDEQFLVYQYGLEMKWEEGQDAPGAGLLGAAVGQMGFDFRALSDIRILGKERRVTLKVQGDISKENINSSEYQPKLFKKLRLDPPEIKAFGSGKTEVSKEFVEYHSSGLEVKHTVQGSLDASTKANILPILNKIPYVGPALLALEKFGDLKVFIDADGGIALFSQLTWLTASKGVIYNEPEIDRVGRRHFLGGVEGGPMLEPSKPGEPNPRFEICFNFGLGLNVALGERAGASGKLLLTGNDCSAEVPGDNGLEKKPSAVILVNPAGDWPFIKRISGGVNGEIKAFLDAWVTRYEKEWVWELIKFDYQFGTDPVLHLVPMSIQISEKTLRDQGSVRFIGKAPVLIDHFLSSGSYSMSSDDGAVLFTDLANNGEFQLKIATRSARGTWDSALLVHSGGVVLDTALMPLTEGGWWMAWSEVAIADENNPFAPTTIYAAQLGDDGQFVQPSHVVSVTPDATVELKLVDMQGFVGLVAVTSDGGPGSALRSLMATSWTGTEWGDFTPLSESAALNAFEATGWNGALQWAWIDAERNLNVGSWNAQSGAITKHLLVESMAHAIGFVERSDTLEQLSLYWTPLSGGLGRLNLDSNGEWVDEGLLLDPSLGTPRELLAVTAQSDPPLQVVAWTFGSQTTDIYYAIFETSGALHTMPIPVTRFSQGAYFDLSLAANDDGSATVGTRHRLDTYSLRVFHLPVLSDDNLGDADGDTMPDGYELAIVDYFADDALTSIEEVLPVDDFDQDTYSNLQEIADGSNPVDPFSVPGGEDVVEASPYDIWRFDHFGDVGDQSALTDPDADPENDRIPNKFEYALLLDPNIKDVEGLPTYTMEDVEGEQYFTLQFRRRANLEAFDLIVEVSNNLLDWTSGPGATTVISVEPSGEDGEIWTIRDNTPVGERRFRFMRISIRP